MNSPTYAERKEVFITYEGRWEGWHVYLQDSFVCNLIYNTINDHNWDWYVIANIAAPYQPEDDKFWENPGLRFVSRISERFQHTQMLCRWSAEHKTSISRWRSGPS